MAYKCEPSVCHYVLDSLKLMDVWKYTVEEMR